MNPRRLYRSRDRRLAGVAGGMAEYLDIDPTIMRILWVLAGLLSVGFAILAYILLAIVIPDAPWSPAPASQMWGQAPQAPAPGSTPPAAPMPEWTQPAQAGWSNPQWQSGAPAAGTGSGWGTASQPPSGWGTASSMAAPQAQGRGIGAAGAVGIILVAIGGIALLNVAIPGWVVPAAVGPMIIILIGAAFLVSSFRRAPQEATPAMSASSVAPASATAPATPASAITVVDATADTGEATAVDIPVAGSSAEG